MQSRLLKMTWKKAIQLWAIVLLAATASFAQQPYDVYLTAQRYTKSLPGGATSPMWIFASCDATFSACTPASSSVASGVVEVGSPGPQIDVPLGATSLVLHLRNQLSVPVSIVIPGMPGGILGTPVYFNPATGNQVPVGTPGARVRSFTLEVAPGATAAYTWASPKPGTYLYESGTMPSIQVPMGLYGALTVHSAATQAYLAPESAFNAERSLLFSEIDPVQNTAVDGAASISTYPSTVQYKPVYFLINGVAYDKAATSSSTFSAGTPPPGSAQWKVLLRLLNAGSESHTALSLGLPMTLIAEDGNVLPTLKRVQSDVLLAAGKTMDVIVSPAPTDITYPLFDRMLRLTSAGSTPDSGMIAYLQVGAGTPPPVAGSSPAAVNDSYAVSKGAAFSDNVLTNDLGLNVANLVSSPKNGTLTLNADGSFTYTPNAHFSGTDYFSYYGMPSPGGTHSNVASVALNVSFANEAPTAQDDGVFKNSVGMTIRIAKPGVLGNDVDNDGDALTASSAQSISPGLAVTLNNDGSFTATVANPGTYTFQYLAKDAALQSAPATVTLQFGSTSNLTMTVVDPTATPNQNIAEYRWLVEEDRTWHHEGFNPLAPSQALDFHASNMPVVAQGCVGALCTEQVPISDAVLDPTKYYYVSVLPNDAGSGEGHSVGGAPIRPGQTSVQVLTNPQPLKTAQISVLIFEDNSPTNGAPDGNEAGLNNFQITVLDAGGRYGMNGGQMSFDAFGNPLKNALRGTPGCPGTDPVGIILTCPDGSALIQNVAPGKYTLLADPPAGARRTNNQNSPLRQWVQTATIEGTRGIDAWVKSAEPPYFQEFGPPGYHVFIGFIDANANKPSGPNTITGTVTNLHMSRPPDQSLYDSQSREALAFTTCWVGLNSGNGVGDNIESVKCNDEGKFTFTGIPNGTYELVIWDQWLDQIIASRTVTVPGNNNLGNVPVFSWFSRVENNIFVDDGAGNPANAGNNVWDDGEQPLPNAPIAIRFRDGSMYQFSTMDNSGYYSFDEAFPFFNWLVVDADPVGYKSTGVDITVDGGGDVASDAVRPGVLNSTYPTGENTHRMETGPVRSEGWQGFIGQTAVLNWARRPFEPGENGGITGMISYASTRSEDDVRMAVINEWEPAVPNVKVRLYKQVQTQTGQKGLVFVAETTSTSWDASKPTGCPGQSITDAFYAESLAKFGHPQDHCYDGMHNWNQIRPAVYDGRYSFTGIPSGTYVVEVVVPPGYELVKEEDKNVLIGDSYIAPVPVESMFGVVNVMPDQALVRDAFAPSPGVANPPCVGDERVVPANLSLFPDLAAPYAGALRSTCDRKEVTLTDQSQGLADFHLFTSVPLASHFTGMILDDLSQEFNPASPNFGEKWAPPFVPVSIRDFNGREIGRTYSDQWGIFNGLVPSTWNANVPLPSGYSPGMVTTCMNDPGPIHANLSDPSSPLITDPQYNPMYSNFCYTMQYMPGTTTYLDTPVLPVAAFASGYNPVDCAYPEGSPVIKRVDGNGDGPFMTPGGTRTLHITAMGPTEVPNPAYEGPSATVPPFNQKTIVRDEGFGAQCTAVGAGCVAVSSVKIGNVAATSLTWSATDITAVFPAGVTTGELSITRGDTGRTTVNTVTVTVENASPRRVPGTYSTIQAAVDAANPGDLVLVSPGTYEELVVMWKPVRLQGSGAGSTFINAAKFPAEKLDIWRAKVQGLFDAGTIDLLPGQNGVDGAPIIGPGLLGTEEGAGITVLAKNDGNGPLGPRSFRNHPSRIDGFGITGGDSGGGIFVNGWAHFLEISNNRVYGNAGLYHGGVRVGHPFLLDLTGNGPFGFNSNVNIHHNAITTNGAMEGAAGGGISLCTGTDNYNVKFNFICGNFSGGDGGGIGHLGLSNAGVIANNQILFNQNYNQSLNVSGGGIFIGGETPVGGGLTLGSGTVTIDANLIQGNHAGAGHGGGIRTQQVNGADVQRAANNPNSWWQVTITNNMIVNNVAGYSGAGISLQDTARSTVVNNTVMNNDSTATVGSTFTAGPNTSVSQPAGISSERHSTGPNGLAGAFTPNTSINAPYRVFSNPTLTNNIIYGNRSFHYDGSGGTAGLVPALTQSAVGNCPTGALYWDLGLVGDTSPTPGATRLNPTSSILTSTSGYPGNSATNPQVASGYCNGPRTLRLITEVTSLTPVPALDEGGNWIDVRWGPLTPMGNYHLSGSSPVNNGSAAGAPNHDFDGDSRPQGGTVDIGADEVGSGSSGGGGNVAKPALSLLDNFNRANANNLGSNWSQLNLLGLAALRVNSNQALAAASGAAIWNVPSGGFGANQAAAFTFANTTLNNAALMLKGTAGVAGAPLNFIRVQYQTTAGGQVVIATSTNAGVSYTTRGTLSGAFASGDTLTAQADGSGTVSVWKTSAGTDSYLGSVTITPNTGWTGSGRVGLQLPTNSRVDDFAAGTLP